LETGDVTVIDKTVQITW